MEGEGAPLFSSESFSSFHALSSGLWFRGACCSSQARLSYLDDVQRQSEERRGGIALGFVEVPRPRHRKGEMSETAPKPFLLFRSFSFRACFRFRRPTLARPRARACRGGHAETEGAEAAPLVSIRWRKREEGERRRRGSAWSPSRRDVGRKNGECRG